MRNVSVNICNLGYSCKRSRIMSLPPFMSNGWLPKGIHDATMDELEERCGQPFGCDRRIHFMADLEKYVTEAKKCKYVKSLIINGSFISNQSKPSDIDIMVVLSDSFNKMSPEIALWERNLVDRGYVRKNYGRIDIFSATEDSLRYKNLTVYWSTDKEKGEPKGMVRIQL